MLDKMTKLSLSVFKDTSFCIYYYPCQFGRFEAIFILACFFSNDDRKSFQSKKQALWHTRRCSSCGPIYHKEAKMFLINF